jgi:hypothetical protein
MLLLTMLFVATPLHFETFSQNYLVNAVIHVATTPLSTRPCYATSSVCFVRFHYRPFPRARRALPTLGDFGLIPIHPTTDYFIYSSSAIPRRLDGEPLSMLFLHASQEFSSARSPIPASSMWISRSTLHYGSSSASSPRPRSPRVCMGSSESLLLRSRTDGTTDSCVAGHWLPAAILSSITLFLSWPFLPGPLSCAKDETTSLGRRWFALPAGEGGASSGRAASTGGAVFSGFGRVADGR